MTKTEKLMDGLLWFFLGVAAYCVGTGLAELCLQFLSGAIQ